MAVKRKIPVTSLIIIHFMNVIYSISYLILKPLGLSPAAMAFLSGGLFGLLLLPTFVLYGLLFLLREYALPEEGKIHDILVYLLYCTTDFWPGISGPSPPMILTFAWKIQVSTLQKQLLSV